MKKIGLMILALFAPMSVFAQYGQAQAQAQVFNVLDFVKRVFNFLLPLSLTLAILFFFWSLFKFIKAGGGEEAAEAKSALIWSFVIIFCMVSLWGVVALLGGLLGIGQTGSVGTPCVLDSDPAMPGCQ